MTGSVSFRENNFSDCCLYLFVPIGIPFEKFVVEIRYCMIVLRRWRRKRDRMYWDSVFISTGRGYGGIYFRFFNFFKDEEERKWRYFSIFFREHIERSERIVGSAIAINPEYVWRDILPLLLDLWIFFLTLDRLNTWIFFDLAGERAHIDFLRREIRGSVLPRRNISIKNLKFLNNT